MSGVEFWQYQPLRVQPPLVAGKKEEMNCNSGYNQGMDLVLIIPLLLGYLSGLLVNYLADVLPETRTLSRPVCLKCQAQINWTDYLFFRRCNQCGKRRSLRTYIVQAVMTVIPVLMWVFPGQSLPFLLEISLLIYLAIVLVIDLEHRLILHPVSIIGAVLGLGTGIFLRSSTHSLNYGIITTLLGGAAGFGIMLIFYFIGEMYVKYMAKKRGLPADEVALGFGDVNLSGILGLMVGWEYIFSCLFFAILAGGLASLVIIAVLLLTRKYKSFTAIPYAPFLIVSAAYFLFLLR
jgi:prepilin signal peptidase PulO-like enzyme (type II secretory pathway)